MNLNSTLLVILLGCLVSTMSAQTPTLSPNAIDFATAGYADGPIHDQADWVETNPGSFVMESGVLVARDSANAKAIFQLPFSKDDSVFTVAMKFQITLTNASPSGNRIAIATEFRAENDTAAGAERFIHRFQRRGNGSNYRLQTNKQEGPNQPNRITGDIPQESFGLGANDTVSDELWLEATYTKLDVDSGWTVYTRVYNLTGDSLIKDLAPADTFLSSAAFHSDTSLYAAISLGQSWSESQIASIRIMAFDAFPQQMTTPPPPVDTIAPTLTINSNTSVVQGTPISVTSSEDGTIYLVPEGTAQDLAAIMAAQVETVAATANMAVEVPTNNTTFSNYILYATDTAENVSNATEVVEITTSSISAEFQAETAIYPNPATEKLIIKSESQLSLIELYNLQGQKVLTQPATGKDAEMDLEELTKGLYLIKIFDTNNRSFVARIFRQ